MSLRMEVFEDEYAGPEVQPGTNNDVSSGIEENSCQQTTETPERDRSLGGVDSGRTAPQSPAAVVTTRSSKLQCQICLKSFNHRRTLRDHVLRHGEKQHKCDVCGKAFYGNNEVLEHMREAHQGCSKCERVFRDSDELRWHLCGDTGQSGSTSIEASCVKEEAASCLDKEDQEKKWSENAFVGPVECKKEEPDEVHEIIQICSDDINIDKPSDYVYKPCRTLGSTSSFGHAVASTHLAAVGHTATTAWVNDQLADRKSDLSVPEQSLSLKTDPEQCDPTGYHHFSDVVLQLTNYIKQESGVPPANSNDCDIERLVKRKSTDSKSNGLSRLSSDVAMQLPNCIKQEPLESLENNNNGYDIERLGKQKSRDSKSGRLLRWNRDKRGDSEEVGEKNSSAGQETRQDHGLRHDKKDASAAQEKHKCSTCGNVYSNRKGLLRHVRENHSSCSVCKKAFLSKSDLNSHMVEEHQSIKSQVNTCLSSSAKNTRRLVRVNYKEHEETSDENSGAISDASLTGNDCSDVSRGGGSIREGDVQASTKGSLDRDIRSVKAVRDEIKVGSGEDPGDSLAIGDRDGQILIQTNVNNSQKVPQRKGEPTASSEGRVNNEWYRKVLEMFQCSICLLFFSNEQSFRHHELTHDKDATVYPCEYCGEKFFHSLLLKRHVASVCRKETKKKTTRGYITDDEDLMSSLKRFKKYECNICNKVYNLRRSYLSHVEMQHKQGKKECDICGKIFSNSHCLMLHRKNMHFPTFKCSECPKAFGSQARLDKHKAMHRSPTVPCECCGKMFKTKELVKRHVLLVHKKDGEKFKCDLCSKLLKSKETFASHKKLIHGAIDKAFACDRCGKSYRTKGQLGVHKLTHSEERTHKCVMCGKGFKSKVLLERHMIYHGEKTVKCEVCAEAFYSKSNLMYHMLKHTGERKFKCDICQKAFGRKQILETHMLSHTGAKPFQCVICDKAFGRKTDLNKHNRENHVQ